MLPRYLDAINQLGARPDEIEDVRVIYMSGFAGAAHSSLDLDAPGTLFLQKPFHPNELASSLAQVMAGQRA